MNKKRGWLKVYRTHLRGHVLLIVIVESQRVLQELALHRSDMLSACLLRGVLSGEAGLLFRHGSFSSPTSLGPGFTVEVNGPNPPSGLAGLGWLVCGGISDTTSIFVLYMLLSYVLFLLWMFPRHFAHHSPYTVSRMQWLRWVSPVSTPGVTSWSRWPV